jgi:lipid II:glycine glycyltransferase (peptidoglycan interpeptide bridge formation enzyme)
MKFVELNENEFKKYSEIVNCKNFFQTTMMLDRYKKENKEYYLVGVKDHENVIGGSLLVVTLNKGKKIFNAYKGPLLDYQNKSLLIFMINNLKEFVKQHGGYLLYIDPYIVSQARDTDGHIVSNGLNNLHVKEELINLGCQYIGEYTQVKWNYCLDINGLSKEEIFKTFKPNTRNNINKTLNKYLLNVRKLSYDELDQFKRITEDTCKRRGFPDKSLAYYQNMYESFKDQVVFYICEIDLDKYISHLKEENNVNQNKIDSLSDSPQNRNKKTSFKQEIDSNLKKITEAEELKKEKGSVMPLSCAMFILFGSEIVYLFSGSYDEYMNFCGQYRLQWEIISYACDQHYERYNFYGIKDLFNPQGKDYGVYEFKKGFSGYVEELLGTFVLPITNYGKLTLKIKKLFKKQ